MLGVAASGTPAKAAGVDAVDTAAAHAAASRRFLAEVVQALVARDQPGDAVTAALMVRGAADAADATRLPSLPSREELLRRADAASPRDPLVAWLRQTLLCLPQGKGCDARRGIQELIDLDPHNAFPWTLALIDAQQRKDVAGAATALSNAAAATVFDDYAWTIDHRVLSALATLPELPVERDPAAVAALHSEDGFDADGSRMALGLGFLLAISIPPYSVLLETCRPRNDGAIDPKTASECKALATRLMDPAGTRIRWQVGQGIARRLTTDAAERDALDAANRRMTYLSEIDAELMVTITADPVELRAYGERRRNAPGGEIEFARSELERAGLPLEPPAGWRSMAERWSEPLPPAKAMPKSGGSR